MSSKYSLSIDEVHIQELKAAVPQRPEIILSLAVQLLIGDVDDGRVAAVAEECGLDIASCVSLTRAAGSLFWEFAKSGTSNPATISAILLQLGLQESLADQFGKVYDANRRVLGSLKNSMTISFMQYKNFSWRLDVELGRRNMHAMTAPKFQMRLDLENSGAASDISESVHIQSDFANLKRLQSELQSAVDETSSVHAQRISRYIT